MTEEKNKDPEAKPAPRVTVDYRPGRWGRVFHLFDRDGNEIILDQAEALKLARSIIKVAKR